MGFPWNEALSTGAAIISAAAAAAAWQAARRSNSTADAVAKIERERWHADLTPQIDLSVLNSGRDNHLRLNVHLAGPDHLQHLDELVVSIGDDDVNHTIIERIGGPTQAEVDAFVWGPFRFVPLVDGADENGRRVAPVSLAVGRGRPFLMERTRPARWMIGTQQEWQQRYQGHPIRLILTCRRGNEKWVIARQIPNPPLTEPTA